MRAATRGVRASAVDAFAFDPSPAGGGRGQGEGLLASLAGLLIASSALAQSNVPPSYGHDFVTVGAPGNRAALASERDPSNPVSNIIFPNLGAVNYSYRMTRTEVTAGQWFEFVKAYSRFADEDGVSRGVLSGRWGIGFSSLNPAIAPNWTLDPNAANIGQSVSLNLTPLYCNWLHNGRPTEGPALTRAAFETGAYAVRNSGTGVRAWQRLQGALYWVPSIDEWVKATYYDPNRYGEGQEGYWPYSGRSATPLVGGAPGVGQTSAGWTPPGGQYPPGVGSYPNTVSPWGLLDTSGGDAEFTDTITFPGNIPGWTVVGTSIGGLPFADYLGQFSYNVTRGAFRVASAVPSPGGILLLTTILGVQGMRRQRMT